MRRAERKLAEANQEIALLRLSVAFWHSEAEAWKAAAQTAVWALTDEQRARVLAMAPVLAEIARLDEVET